MCVYIYTHQKKRPLFIVYTIRADEENAHHASTTRLEYAQIIVFFTEAPMFGRAPTPQK
jgi:hypothetical protein